MVQAQKKKMKENGTKARVGHSMDGCIFALEVVGEVASEAALASAHAFAFAAHIPSVGVEINMDL